MLCCPDIYKLFSTVYTVYKDFGTGTKRALQRVFNAKGNEGESVMGTRRPGVWLWGFMILVAELPTREQ